VNADLIYEIVALTFAAFCIGLAVRTVNGRRQWAKRLFRNLAAAMVLYALGFGPACFAARNFWIARRPVYAVYRPIIRSSLDGTSQISSALRWWMHFFGAEDWVWADIWHDGLYQPSLFRGGVTDISG
jgi:hypothetical protein